MNEPLCELRVAINLAAMRAAEAGLAREQFLAEAGEAWDDWHVDAGDDDD